MRSERTSNPYRKIATLTVVALGLVSAAELARGLPAPHQAADEGLPTAARGPQRATAEPLPLDVALSLRGHNGRSPVDLSPDGRWVAHTVESDDTVPRDNRQYAATGFPFAEGDSRMEATVTQVATGEAIRLGGATASSWAAAWSPQGDRVAFYSDEGGEAGLWVWDMAERRARRVGDVAVRPVFGFEVPRWSPDGRSLLVKVVPEGKTIAELNALAPQPSAAGSSFPEVEPGLASVRVRTAGPAGIDATGDDPPDPDDTEPDDPDPGERQPPVGDVGHGVADLAIVEIATGAVTRIARNVPVRAYAFSPDATSIAFTVLKGYEPASQQPNYDLAVAAADGTSATTLATNVRMGYGIEWSWSPDGSAIAWFASGQMARREVADGAPGVVVVDTDGGDRRALAAGAPAFDPGDGEYAPLWSASGSEVHGIADGELWRADVASGNAERVAGADGWQMRAIVTADGSTPWSSDGGTTLWVLGRARGGAVAGIHRVDTRTGEAVLVNEADKVYSAIFNLDASSASGEIAFVATDQRRTHDVWLLNTTDGTTRQATRLNAPLERYALGDARLIRWRSLDGEELAGSLLLPPGYREGDRLPLVVWVYGGSMGSGYLNRFGLMGSLPNFNMHVLATRGYAVLFPDAPLRVGSPMADLMSTVMPGVNAAIDQGYADPERLAIMGQSYGSYCTLAIITQTTRFKAAVITAAVLHPDLVADYLGGIGYYEQGQGGMGGSIWEFPDRYVDNSPLFRFDRIETPILIGQGQNDGDLVPAEAIFNALERLDKPVEYRLYENEGHVITQRPNVLDFWQRRLEFLAEHLELEVDAAGRVRAR